MSTRTNHVPRCDPVRWEGSSCQFLMAITTLATMSAKNSATKRYFHEPRALRSSVFPITKSQKSENGFGMDAFGMGRLRRCDLAGAGPRRRGNFCHHGAVELKL